MQASVFEVEVIAMPGSNKITPFDDFNGNPDLSAAPLIIDQIYSSNNSNNLSGEVLSKLMLVSAGGGFRTRNKEGAAESEFEDSTANIAYVVLESTGKEIDWLDQVDKVNGLVYYYGDNRKPGQTLHGTKRNGNSLLRDIFCKLKGNQDDDRKAIPPVFMFQSAGGRDRLFVGLLVPGNGQLGYNEHALEAIWRVTQNERYQNYRAMFSVLDAGCIDRRWLKDLIRGEGYESQYAPAAWKKWVDSGQGKLLKTTPTRDYRKPKDQEPDDAEGKRILEAIYKYCEAQPGNFVYFEYCAMDIVSRIDANFAKATMAHTRASRDGGRDAIGRYPIGSNDSGITIDFAIEAKCYSPDHGAGVREFSRAVSRLRSRQFAILVVTSYLNEQAYQELKNDGHPLMVISGKDIVNILRNSGIKTVDEINQWLPTLREKWEYGN